MKSIFSVIIILILNFGFTNLAHAIGLAEGAKKVPSHTWINVTSGVGPYATSPAPFAPVVYFQGYTPGVVFDATVDIFEVIHTICDLTVGFSGNANSFQCLSK